MSRYGSTHAHNQWDKFNHTQKARNFGLKQYLLLKRKQNIMFNM